MNVSTKSLMKAIGLDYIVADSKRFCNAAFDRGNIYRIDPTTGDNIECPMCRGSEGFVVIDGDRRVWSCADSHCISVNARQPPSTFGSQRPVITLEQAGCPKSMYDAHISHIEIRNEWIPGMRDLRKNGVQTLILHGPPGTGKTYMACALMADHIERNKQTARFISWDGLHRGWLEEFSDSSPSKLSYSVSEIPLLVIDDLGSREMSEKFLSWVQVVLGIRYDCSRPTIITANMSPDQIRECVGEANWSRLCPKSILVDGNDRRWA